MEFNAPELTSQSLFLLGAILPPVLALITQKKWSEQAKALVAMGACFLLTLGYNALYLDDGLSLRGIGSTIVAAFVAYHSFWKPVGVTGEIHEMTDQ